MSSFQTFNQVLENEQRIYVPLHPTSCDVSKNPDAEEPNESSPIHYHLSPSPQFEHVENFRIFHVIGLHGCNILPVIQVGNL